MDSGKILVSCLSNNFIVHPVAGISASDQAKLFEPYSFVTSGWVQKAGVSGLGLSMAKRFVERCGGSIGVDSVEGTGSTFFFSIPFPIVEIDVGSDREALKTDSGAAALLEKSEVAQSTSSSGVTVVHESITPSRRRSSMGKGEDLKTPPKGRAAKVTDVKGEDLKTVPKGRAAKTPDVAHEDPAGFRRKVLLVEDTRINRVSYSLHVSSSFNVLPSGWENIYRSVN